jgi:hypothetical protein
MREEIPPGTLDMLILTMLAIAAILALRPTGA